MVIFNSVHEYLKEMKVGDYVVFGGLGIVDGLDGIDSKYDVYKVQEGSTRDNIIFRAYRGRKYLTISPLHMKQRIALISDEKFKGLPN